MDRLLSSAAALAAAALSYAAGDPQPQNGLPPESPKAQEPGEIARVVGHALHPRQVEPTPERIRSLHVPSGFRVAVFAQGLKHARMMCVGEDGTVYLSRNEEGEVLALKDSDRDGMVDETRTVLTGIDLAHGLAIHDKKLYVCGVKKLVACDIGADGSLGDPQTLIADLPDGSQHPNRTIGFGPDGKLYISVGSTCNACVENNKEDATLLRAEPDGSSRAVFAKGLRNTIGFAWHPVTHALWGFDHGIDWLGDDVPPEELNRIEEGKNYGWPYAWGNRQSNPAMNDPPGSTVAERAAKSEAPVLTYQAHSAPIWMLFYTGEQFPQEYKGDAFVAMRGSWNRAPAVGYKVVRVKFKDGEPTGFEDFLTGFLTDEGKSHFGRLAGLAQAPDGSLLVSDDTNGVIYRVFRDGAGK